MKDHELLALWYEALHSQCGIEVRSNDPERLMQRLYAARRKAAGDEALQSLSIVRPPQADLLFIVKRESSD